IRGIWNTGCHIAECTGAGTDFSHYHAGGVLLVPALADIRAARLLADRDQPVLLHARPGCGIALRNRSLDPDPFRLAQHLRVRTVRLFGMANPLGVICRGSVKNGNHKYLPSPPGRLPSTTNEFREK